MCKYTVMSEKLDENNVLVAKKLSYEEMLAKTQFSVFVVYMFMYFPFGILTIGGQRSNYPEAVHYNCNTHVLFR